MGLKDITDLKSACQVSNAQILVECLHHLAAIEPDGVELRTMQPRKNIKKVAYGISKHFGNRNCDRDLYVWHPSILTQTPFDLHIPLLGITNVRVFYRTLILGKQSMRTKDSQGVPDMNKANSLLPNQVEIDVRTNQGPKIAIWVNIELSGQAFCSLLGDSKPKVGNRMVYKGLVDKLEAKWGSRGLTFGLYQRKNAEGKNIDGDGYRTFRMHNGVAMVETVAAGWITGTAEPRGQNFEKQEDGSYINTSRW